MRPVPSPRPTPSPPDSPMEPRDRGLREARPPATGPRVLRSVLRARVSATRLSPDTIGALAGRVANKHATRRGRPLTFAEDALARLHAEPWPGNVRQLQTFLERLVALAQGVTLTGEDVERELACQAARGDRREGQPSGTLQVAVRDAGRDAVRQALERAEGNRTLAARLLGISRRALYYKLDEYGLG